MLQIHLSQALSKDLKAHVNKPVDIEPTALQWYGHKVVVDGEDCIILMELQSRYAMVFCGITQYHLDNFLDVVQERLWREVCAIVQLEEDLPEHDMALMSDMVLNLSREQFFQQGYNRSVTTHINQVVDQLKYTVEDERYALPADMGQAMEFGLIINDQLRKRKGDVDYFVPLEVFRDFWLGLLDVLLSQELEASEGDDDLVLEGEHESKVIHVDFVNRKKK